ncbi:ferrous iron transport protein A [Paenibacillus sp. ACRRX]|uniref:FeoA family protein n=1 Tax=unclassified Paenibacillus TaxID=185978 RepID=UPI001EF4974F|nr:MULTISPECIES: FeoA family protein [unclassified Paenibacillus]MCG7409878.1 ferrous iron transport protein A [Paenibacillus sp. ACRRX]MDK8183056.1 FeoA family protein [Paenibacillus sp. UMB4589-SE434]
MCKSLGHLKPGETACITNLAKLSDAVSHRLLDLGVTKGTLVKVKRCSLLGGPLMLEANGQLFGLRRVEATLIEVDAC